MLGFSANLLKWFESYLKGRVQRVLFSSSVSDDISMTSGVPQGSHSGPFLFVIFTNDLVNVIKNSHVLIYADDVKIFKVINNPEDSILLQNDLTNFYVWCKENFMFLNVGKCKFMSFHRKYCPIASTYHINGITLDKTDGTKDLGVLLDSKLNFHSHMDYIIFKANSMFGFIKRWTKGYEDPYVLKTLYTAFVRSILEYGAIIWNPHYSVHTSRIEAIQRKFLRFALRNLPWTDNRFLPHYEDRLRLLSLPTLQRRRSVAQVLFVFKLLTGSINSPELLLKINLNIFPRLLRIDNNCKFLHINHHRTNYGLNEPLTAASRAFNLNFDKIDFHLSIDSIKSQLLLCDDFIYI